VVNIITKRGQGPPSGFLDLEAGNYETFRERAGVSGSEGPWSYSLGVSRLDFGGQFDNDDQDLTSVNARIGYALPNKGELSLTGRFQDSHTGIPFATVFPDFDPNREQNQRLGLLSLEWRQPWTSMWEHRLRVSGVDETLEFRDKPDPEHPFAFPSDISTRRIEAEWYHFVKIVPWNTITVGGEYRNEVGEVKGSYKGDGPIPGPSSSRTRSRCSTACTSPGASATTATACSRTRRRPAWRLLSREGDRHAPEGELGPGLPRADVQRALLSRPSRRAGRSAIPI
jgi:vitamin B12 transporter